MTKSPEPNQVSTFVVRVWHDRAASNRKWYGRIENIHTGQQVAFHEWRRLADFIRAACAIEEQESQSSTSGG